MTRPTITIPEAEFVELVVNAHSIELNDASGCILRIEKVRGIVVSHLGVTQVFADLERTSRH